MSGARVWRHSFDLVERNGRLSPPIRSLAAAIFFCPRRRAGEPRKRGKKKGKKVVGTDVKCRLIETLMTAVTVSDCCPLETLPAAGRGRGSRGSRGSRGGRGRGRGGRAITVCALVYGNYCGFYDDFPFLSRRGWFIDLLRRRSSCSSQFIPVPVVKSKKWRHCRPPKTTQFQSPHIKFGGGGGLYNPFPSEGYTMSSPTSSFNIFFPNRSYFFEWMVVVKCCGTFDQLWKKKKIGSGVLCTSI